MARTHRSVGFGVASRYADRWNCWSAGVMDVKTIDGGRYYDDPIKRESVTGAYVTFRHFGYACGGPVVTLAYAPDIVVDGESRRQSSAFIGWQWGVEPARSLGQDFGEGSAYYYGLGAMFLILGFDELGL